MRQSPADRHTPSFERRPESPADRHTPSFRRRPESAAGRALAQKIASLAMSWVRFCNITQYECLV